jgi:hypothetical protein
MGATNRDVPPKCIPTNRDVLDGTKATSRVSEPDPSQFGNAHHPPASIQSANPNFPLTRARLNPEALTNALTFESGIAAFPGKESSECSVKIAKRLLEDVGVRFSKPRQFSLGGRKFRILTCPRNVLMVHAPRGLPLLQAGIPNGASAPAPTLKGSSLISGRVEAISKDAVIDHEHMFVPEPDRNRFLVRAWREK